MLSTIRHTTSIDNRVAAERKDWQIYRERETPPQIICAVGVSCTRWRAPSLETIEHILFRSNKRNV